MPLQKKTVLEGDRLVAAIAFLGQQNPPVKFVGDGAGGLGDGKGDDMRRGLRVNVSAVKLGDEGFEALCSAIGSNSWVQKLNASRCGFGPRGATHLGDALRSNGSLRELWLENNHIGNQGAEHIIESALPENRGRVDEDALKVSKGIDYANQVREENERQEAIDDPGLEGSSRGNYEAGEASATDDGDSKVRGGVVVVGTPSSRRRSSIVSLAGSVTLPHGAFLNEPQILTVLNLKACGIGPQWPAQILLLTTLRNLNLADNLLEDIPIALVAHTLLSILDLQGNPLPPSGELPAGALAVWSGNAERLPDPMHPGNFAMFYMGSPALGAPPEDILNSTSAQRILDYASRLDAQAAHALKNVDPRTFGSRAAKLEVGPFVKRKDGKPRDEMEQAAVLHRFVREVGAGGKPESRPEDQGDGSAGGDSSLVPPASVPKP